MREVEIAWAEFFGGCTRFQGHGSYLASTGKVVSEKVDIVESFCDDSKLRQHVARVRSIAAELCVTLNQEAIAIVVNDEMELIRGETR